MNKKKIGERILSCFMCTVLILSGIASVNSQTAKADIVTTIKSVSAAGFHTTALRKDGTVVCWGCNDYGQLGDGTITNSNVPVIVKDADGNTLTDVKAVSSGWFSAVALKNDGTVWCWGKNRSGELGNGTNIDSKVAVQAKNLNNIIAISAGNQYTTAIKNDGTVWCFGNNCYGQLGDGTNTNSNVPVQAKNLTGIKSISGGFTHTAAIKNDGTVWCFGNDSYGQLGDGTTTNSNVPVQAKNLIGIKSVSAGNSYTTVIKNDGTVWCFGRNSNGQLGDGTTTDSNVPVQAKNLTNIIAISSGDFHTTALKSDGTVWCFGDNDDGDFGDGTFTASNVAVQAVNLTNVTAVSAGAYHTTALKSDGTVWCFGLNRDGELANEENPDSSSLPVQSQLLTNDEKAVETDMKSLEVRYASYDSQNNVTQDLTLPASGANGTSITWSSDNAAVSISGKVTRPDFASKDAKVTLIATVKKGNTTATVTYVVTVKALPKAADTKSNTSDGSSSSKAILPKTGSPFDFMSLGISGLVLMLIGSLIIIKKKREKEKR